MLHDQKWFNSTGWKLGVMATSDAAHHDLQALWQDRALAAGATSYVATSKEDQMDQAKGDGTVIKWWFQLASGIKAWTNNFQGDNDWGTRGKQWKPWLMIGEPGGLRVLIHCQLFVKHMKRLLELDVRWATNSRSSLGISTNLLGHHDNVPWLGVSHGLTRTMQQAINREKEPWITPTSIISFVHDSSPLINHT